MQLFELPILWMPWMVAALLCLLLLISALQPSTLAISFQTLSSPIQRRYQAGGNHPLVEMLCKLFELGTISLALLMAVVAFTGHNDALTLPHYGLTAVVIVVVTLLKALIDKWIQLTFRATINEKIYIRYRNQLWLLVGVVLWLMLLIHPWLSNTVLWIAPSAMMALYFAVLWWKIMQVFGWTFRHIGYALLYMLHAEVLPLAVIIVGIGTLIK